MDVKPGYKRTEVGVIPEDWNPVPVGRVGAVITGKALAVDGAGEQRPYLRTKNVFDGRIVIDDVLSMPMTDAQFDQFSVRPGDVLLNEGQSLELVGRCAVYRGEYGAPCAIQNQLLRFRARPGISGDFAAHLFRFSQQTGVFARIAFQTTSIAHLGGKRFERLVLPWPESGVEQQGIATALNDVDELLEGHDRLITKKRDLKHAAMQQLLSGQTRLPGFTEEWRIKSLADVCSMRSGEGITSANINETTTYPCYGGNGLRGYTSRCTHDGRYALIGRQGALCGNVFGVEGQFFASEHAIVVTATQNCEIRWLTYVLKRMNLNQYSESSAQPGLSVSKVLKLDIAVPPRAEQTAIASVISDMDAEIAALEARRQKIRALKQAMMQELLTGRTRLINYAGATHA